MKVRLNSDAMTQETRNTNKATQCLTVKELIALMDSVDIHIEGKGNGSVILMGCV